MKNINDTFFDGLYKEIWKSIIPPELTNKEVDFMMKFFRLQPGSKILDIMCGYGRHSIALARNGLDLTAVDNLDDYITEIKEIVEKEKLSINVAKANIVEFTTNEEFDLVIWMGNSLCFFDNGDLIKVFQMISSRLKAGGSLLINAWTISEIAFNNHRERTWNNINGSKFIVESRYETQPSRFEVEHLILFGDGQTESKKSVDYVYSIGELDDLTKQTGLKIKEIYSIPGKKRFTLGEPRAYLLVEKI